MAIVTTVLLVSVAIRWEWLRIEKNMRISLIILLLVIYYPGLNGQETTVDLSGKVTFASSQHIYVRFKSTTGISPGDTLYIPSGEKLIPVLTVKNLSSVSCVCIPISLIPLPSDHLIIAKIKKSNQLPVIPSSQDSIPERFVTPDARDTLKVAPILSGNKQTFRGSISVNAYNEIAGRGNGNSRRFRYTLAFDAQNIADSKVSAESYISLRHGKGSLTETGSDLFDILKIYGLSVRYDPGKKTHLTFGRKINARIPALGAVDGLQFEKSFKGLTLGLLAGSRPDYSNYGVNPALFQYGGLVAFDTRSARAFTENSLALIQQMNRANTDRRFLYFQNHSSLAGSIFFMSSLEIDLYKLENNLPKSIFELTQAFLSLRINVTRNFTVSGSYDARKNIIYHESFRNYTDRILEDEMRQGFRLNVSCRPAKNVMFGIRGGYRFLKSDPHPSRNINGYITHSSIPGLRMSATLTGTYLESPHINGLIAGFNLSRSLADNMATISLGYHFADYHLQRGETSIISHTADADLYWQVLEKFMLGINYEAAVENNVVFHRIYLQMRKSF